MNAFDSLLISRSASWRLYMPREQYLFNKQTIFFSSCIFSFCSAYILFHYFSTFLKKKKIFFHSLCLSTINFFLMIFLSFSHFCYCRRWFCSFFHKFLYGTLFFFYYFPNIPYTWWFYVDQPNRTEINFENMIIVHGYCIQMDFCIFVFCCFSLFLLYFDLCVLELVVSGSRFCCLFGLFSYVVVAVDGVVRVSVAYFWILFLCFFTISHNFNRRAILLVLCPFSTDCTKNRYQ